MLIISQDEFLKELAESKPAAKPDPIESHISRPEIPNKIEMENHTYDNFRKPSVPNIPNEVKPVIAALAVSDTQENIAKAFGVSKDTVGNLANDNHKNGEVTEAKINIIERIKEKTLGKIDTCLDFLEVNKNLKPQEYAHLAESLARTHEKLTSKEPAENKTTQFVFYIPKEQNKPEDYEVIDAPS
jgi:hypothetical protein